MYRHLLVPLDQTDLSIQVVGNAVAFARTLGARVTFFHALDDGNRSLRGELDVLRLTSPADYDYAASGRMRELLVKAEAAARAAGVPCEAAWAASSRPADAIATAARERGCDLVFMASHGHGGRLGMAFASRTLDVIARSGVAVLVSEVGEPGLPARAIAVIRDEHRAIAAALHTWIELLARARRSDAPADAQAMRTILDYLRGFPEQLHHPKEEEYLFARLRERTHAVDADLDELERQHARDRELAEELAAAVNALASAADTGAAVRASRDLETLVGRYADFHWDHMGREESAILPAARQHLTAGDWEDIDAAFTHDEAIALHGPVDEAYHRLIARIAALRGD